MSYTGAALDFETVPSALDDEPEADEVQLNLDYAERDTVRDAARTAKDREAVFDECLKGLMSTPTGRSFVRTVMFDWCRTEDSVYSTDHGQMSFAAGERNIGQRLKAAVVRVAPSDYVKMLMENANVRS